MAYQGNIQVRQVSSAFPCAWVGEFGVFGRRPCFIRYRFGFLQFWLGKPSFRPDPWPETDPYSLLDTDPLFAGQVGQEQDGDCTLFQVRLWLGEHGHEYSFTEATDPHFLDRVVNASPMPPVAKQP